MAVHTPVYTCDRGEGALALVLPARYSSPAKTARPRRLPSSIADALDLLGSCADGCTEALMMAHSFTRSAVAVAQPGADKFDQHLDDRDRGVRITAAGRRALAR